MLPECLINFCQPYIPIYYIFKKWSGKDACMYVCMHACMHVCMYPDIIHLSVLSILLTNNYILPYWNWTETTQGRNDPTPKRPTYKAESIHPQTLPKRPGQNDPGPKRPGTSFIPDRRKAVIEDCNACRNDQLGLVTPPRAAMECSELY